MPKNMNKDEGEEPEVEAQYADEDAPEAEIVEEPPLDPLTKAELDRDEYLGNWQRARADFQNLKRRTLEDVESAINRERSNLLEETLTILDYLDMALASPCDSQDAQNLQIGVQMTRDQLWQMLERQSVKPITAEGVFDPSHQQAVATVTTAEVEPGTIVEVVRRGYTIGDRVLRHTQVKVAAAPESDIEQPGPAPAAGQPAEDA